MRKYRHLPRYAVDENGNRHDAPELDVWIDLTKVQIIFCTVSEPGCAVRIEGYDDMIGLDVDPNELASDVEAVKYWSRVEAAKANE